MAFATDEIRFPTRRAVAAALAAASLLAGCASEPAPGWQGYVEGDYVLLAPSRGGRLDVLHVQRGQTIDGRTTVFTLDPSRELAAVREAAERVRHAEAAALNLGQPRREREIDALNAQLAQATAARVLAAQDLQRAQTLLPGGAVSRADFDAAAQRQQQHSARETELRAMLDLARQGIGRQAERTAAQADVDAARAVLAQAEWQLAQRTVAAPAGGRVQDTFYSAGEQVADGRPVLSLLPPQNIKLRFFVAEPALGRFAPGARLRIGCDGCAAPIDAAVSHVSTQAEYTPPVLYHQRARAKLVYMVEARPLQVADAMRLHPGQPVDVTLATR